MADEAVVDLVEVEVSVALAEVDLADLEAEASAVVELVEDGRL